MFYKWKIQGVVMKTSIVFTNLTETATDQRRELSNDRKSGAQLGIFIEVGKAVISTNFNFKKSLVFFFLKK